MRKLVFKTQTCANEIIGSFDYKVPHEIELRGMNFIFPENLGKIKADFFKVTDDIYSFRNSISTKQDLFLYQEEEHTLPEIKDFINLGIVIDGDFEGGFSDKKTHKFQKNQMIMTNYYKSEGFMRLKKEIGAKTLTFLIKKDFILENFPKLRIIPNSFLINTRITNKNINLVQNIFKTKKTEPFYQMRLQNMATDFLLEEFLQIQGETKIIEDFSRKDMQALYLARDILLENLQPMTISEIAKEVGINEFKLKNGFKKLFQATPHQMSLANRLKTAKEYLKKTDLPIGIIANIVGFKSQQNFTAAFKKEANCLPRDFRLD